jgi:hypothetical protein
MIRDATTDESDYRNAEILRKTRRKEWRKYIQ